MSFLKGLGGGGSGGADNFLGNLLGTSGGNVSSWASRIGQGANQIASAGGATPGYQAPQLQTAPVAQAWQPPHVQDWVQGGQGATPPVDLSAYRGANSYFLPSSSR